MAKKEQITKKEKTSKKEVKNKRHPFKDFKAELKKVIWPTPKQLVNSTIAVITIVLIVGALVFVLDFSFNAMNQFGSKLQSNLRNDNSVVTDLNTISDETSDEASSVNNETIEVEEKVQE